MKETAEEHNTEAIDIMKVLLIEGYKIETENEKYNRIETYYQDCFLVCAHSRFKATTSNIPSLLPCLKDLTASYLINSISPA